jgi:drug/metabolite transporter (DMT)-like permease
MTFSQRTHVPAIACAVAASACFAGTFTLVRVLASDLPALEIVFFRNLLGFFIVLPLMGRSGFRMASASSHRLYVARACLGFVAMGLWYVGVAHLPLNDSTALSFTSPLFATLAAIMFLGERVDGARWGALVVGFSGVLVVLRPGFNVITWPELSIIGSAVLVGLNTIIVKQLTRAEPARAIIGYMSLYMVPFSAIAVIPVWTPAPLHTWPALAGVAVLSTAGNLLLTRTLAAWKASSVVSLDFVRLPMVSLLAWFVFGEVADAWAWIGATLIIAATAFSLRNRTTSPVLASGPVEITPNR